MDTATSSSSATVQSCAFCPDWIGRPQFEQCCPGVWNVGSAFLTVKQCQAVASNANAKCLNCSFCQVWSFSSPMYYRNVLLPLCIWTEIKLQVLMLQNLLKVFNGYWRMDIPDWVGDTCWGFIIKTWNSAIHFLPSFSYLLLSNFDFSDKIHFPTWWWWHFTGILKKETFFVI